MTDQLTEKTVRLLCDLREHLEETHLDLTQTEAINELLGEMGHFFEKQKQRAFHKAKETGDVKDLEEARSYMH